MHVGKKYDYTDKSASGTVWYTDVRDIGAKWVEPYFAQGAQDWYVDFGIPFYYNTGPQKGQVRGTITMSFACGGFKNLVHSIGLGKIGYGIITSNEGVFLAHPINEFIGTTNLKSVKEKETNPKLVTGYGGLLAGESGNVEFYNEEQEDHTIFFYDKIPSSGWGIGLMFFRNDLLGDAASLNHRYIKFALTLSLFFLYFSNLLQ